MQWNTHRPTTWFTLALLSLPFVGRAEARSDNSDGAVEGTAVARDLLITGEVLLPDGQPAEGSVVFSDAGGLASVGRDGRFELRVGGLADAAALGITAVGNGGVQLTARRQLSGPFDGKRADVGALLLAEGQACQPEWVPGFGAQPGANNSVSDFAIFDSGSGPALYASGAFTTIGNTDVQFIARWDGSGWHDVGGGLDGTVLAMAVYDDGSGAQLYVSGYFATAGGQPANHVARWNGTTWSEVGGGANNAVQVFAVFDDGSGEALYAGGFFALAGGQPASNLARWDGVQWRAVGGGTNGTVSDLDTFDDGNGPALYVAGTFTAVGGQPASRVARWDGAAWSALGSGLQGVNCGGYALAVFDDGSGPDLYVGGDFESAGGVEAYCIARWDGAAWSALPEGFLSGIDYVSELAVVDVGNGPDLYVGGRFFPWDTQTGVGILRFDGAVWSSVSGGVGNFGGAIATIGTMIAFDDGSGPALYAAGFFDKAGNVAAKRLARWRNNAWEAIGYGLSDSVLSLAAFDDGTGPALYVGGVFSSAGGVFQRSPVRWDGTSWSSVAGGVGGAVRAMAVFDDGAGPALYLGGDFTLAFTDQGAQPYNRIVRWDGSGWSSLGSGMSGFGAKSVHALAVHDDGTGPALYAGGEFVFAGGVEADNVARWNGSAWTPMTAGSGTDGTNGIVRALVSFDDGSGPALYAGGSFTQAGGSPAARIARWDGTNWSPLGAGTNNQVLALAAFDDGSGPALFAAGPFTQAGGQSASRVARWNGAAWSSTGIGMDAPVRALSVVDAGDGAALYAAGDFVLAGGQPAAGIARWNGTQWETIGGGVGYSALALAEFDDGSGPVLHVGGSFASSPGGDSYLARWRACAAPGLVGVPGCFDNPAVLSSPSPGLIAGQSTDFDLAASSAQPGLAILFLGLDGVDGSGCGLLLPGLGELLLEFGPGSLLPAFAVATGAAPLGLATFSLPIPADPQWIGLEFGFQGAHVDLVTPGNPIELSNALTAAIAP